MKVEVGKKYRMRGYPESEVVVFDTNIEPPFSVLAKSKHNKNDHWKMRTYTEDGSYYDEDDGSEMDLVEISPYDDFKVDEPVMVSGNGFAWYRRHFAEVRNDGIPMAWEEGCTRWSSHGRTSSWDFCRKPTPEELG